ncbi:MAG: hypothetical protein ABJN26_06700 [Stappiaceae bacterium]
MLSEPFADIAEKSEIGEDDVLALRQHIYRNDRVDVSDMIALFELNGTCEVTVPAWRALYLEAVADYVVRQETPLGYISPENADWLKQNLPISVSNESLLELDALIAVIEEAVSAPLDFQLYVLQMLKSCILERAQLPGIISADDVDRLRRTLHARGSQGSLAISREEADVLFDLNDATVESENDPAWSDLFVKAIANNLMAARGYRAPMRKEALRQSEWLSEKTEFGSLFSGLLSMSLNDLRGAFSKDESVLASCNQAFEAEGRVAELIEQGEAEWLIGRIDADRQLHENEKALLRFLKEESPRIHPSLKNLLEKVG